MAIVAGIIIVIAAGATIIAVSQPETSPMPRVDSGGNNTDGQQQIRTELNESLNVDVK